MSSPIVLRRDRDFGQVFNAATAFIQQHLRPLVKMVLIVISPFLAAITLVSLAFLDTIPMLFESPFDAGANPLEVGAGFWVMMAVSYVLQVLMIVAVQTVVFAYLAQYERRAAEGEYGEVPSDAVWALSRRQWFRQLLFSFAYVLVFLVFIIPCLGWIAGIYLWVAMALGAPMLMNEQVGVLDAISRSVRIIKSSWWQTFGLLFLSGVVSWVIMLGLSIPSIVLSGVGFITGDVSEVGPIMALVTGIVSFATGLLTNVVYILPLVVTAFQYYNLAEDQSRGGLRDRVARYAEAASETPTPSFTTTPTEPTPAEPIPDTPETAPPAPDADRWAASPERAPGSTAEAPAPADRWAPKPTPPPAPDAADDPTDDAPNDPVRDA